ncbi:MAG: hypothetical protein A3H57_02600 [Candidatus Taylorbacteria bacterium RIFCSPLOWO2_02_FULL_43_11]|uniref:Uncharacterized protein n=1 Tax=Candidatus Taylorbacteria bacterium RIFCSPHIGHO2_02_FULL_43_32b TaxID=1802306 RepID=A0A1G2MFZ0_9BACT|nr:MAG: hypothetical protein A2743_00350 [Candidatus Taylorbacteria bacterium RIFCSPHIGHO2_01_FULL_43_47]OHA22816.1 MAG: hypothetical protein A3C72_02795 [Candidatus Taylorbacteria bacterium RIFCSPHIGHO2_02_FULL_43_32b]OHA30870.1 MAG: hypothetical protein A3B08_01600 [Candidatus Taylorbacteria bacterium RIFCSPLOWO2_01_FULL_43_44]OHA35267.1 MAG: hypothetical protein A3H57_02600 [Candidatus Taylorbacteria bacterium RIFCSPLOWO2_02_FULL_43_11]
MKTVRASRLILGLSFVGIINTLCLILVANQLISQWWVIMALLFLTAYVLWIVILVDKARNGQILIKK